MTDKDLLELKIGVIAEKDIAFQEIVTLVDKPEFIRMLPRLRKEYQIDKFISLHEYTDYLYDEYSKKHNNDNIYLGKYKKLKQFKELFPDQYRFISDKSEMEELGTRLDLECSLLCYEFNRSYLFAEIIKQAIFCAKINGYFYWSAQAHVIDPLLEAVIPEVALPQASILVTPTEKKFAAKAKIK